MPAFLVFNAPTEQVLLSMCCRAGPPLGSESQGLDLGEVDPDPILEKEQTRILIAPTLSSSNLFSPYGTSSWQRLVNGKLEMGSVQAYMHLALAVCHSYSYSPFSLEKK